LRVLTLSIFLLFAASCGEREDLLLLGEWQATSVLEGGDSLRLDPAQVGFVFRPDNRYTFRSTLRYQEAGTWRYTDGFLFARDTTRPEVEERIVAVEKLTADSLEIRMLAEGKERELVFLRQR
jgi:hypothetical protein